MEVNFPSSNCFMCHLNLSLRGFSFGIVWYNLGSVFHKIGAPISDRVLPIERLNLGTMKLEDFLTL